MRNFQSLIQLEVEQIILIMYRLDHFQSKNSIIEFKCTQDRINKSFVFDNAIYLINMFNWEKKKEL